MSEYLGLEVSFNKDYVLKNQSDIEIIGRIDAYPIDRMFNLRRKVGSHIIFVLDSSGSMDEKFLTSTKRLALINGVIEISKNFNLESDVVSVITFNSNATVLCREERDLGKIQSAIREVQNHNGATNFEAAMIAAERVISGDNNYIIFLTDGHSCSGSDSNALKIASELSKKGVILNAMGIGNDFKYDFMRQFSEPSNGITENIDDIKKVVDVFDSIVDSSHYAVIKNTHIYINFPNYLRDIEFYQISPEKRFYNGKIKTLTDGSKYLEINIGNLILGTSNNYLLKFNISTDNRDNISLGDVKLTYTVPSVNSGNLSNEQRLTLNLSSNRGDLYTDTAVDNTYYDAQLTKFMEEVNSLLRENKNIEAAKKLQFMVDTAQKIGDNNLVKEYQGHLNKLKHGGVLTQAEINRLNQKSSVSSIAGRRGIKKENIDLDEDNM